MENLIFTQFTKYLLNPDQSNLKGTVDVTLNLKGTVAHCDLKVSRSQAKIDENFANYFFKTKANNKCFIVLKCTCKGLQKRISEL